MKKYDIAAYIWPSYTGQELRTRMFWPDGIGEWQTVKTAGPKFDGHLWPRKPLLGYTDEADPEVMKQHIELAASHGVNVFIYDWYWFDDRPFLENCLNDGYLEAAKTNPSVKFYLMWANHNAGYTWDKRISDSIFDRNNPAPDIWRGDVTPEQFHRICDRLIERYFTHPLYYKIDGCPVFSIYEWTNLVKGLGGIENTRRELDLFREKVVKAGFPGLHLQLVLCAKIGNDNAISPADYKAMGFDSITHYQYVHFAYVDRTYPEVMVDVEKEWAKVAPTYDTTYFPHISVGWDANPRFNVFVPGIIRDNTPENLVPALEAAKAYADAHPGQAPLITVNAWNEWTEGSYLLPDDLYGYGYLNAIQKVFM